MIDLLKKIETLNKAQADAVDTIQITSPNIRTAVDDLNAAIRQIRQALIANRTAIAYMKKANDEALAAIQGDENNG